MKYCVSISVEGFYEWCGDAPTKEIAKELAIEAASEEDFGNLENIDFDIYNVEREL